jgi:hypothetical protein
MRNKAILAGGILAQRHGMSEGPPGHVRARRVWRGRSSSNTTPADELFRSLDGRTVVVGQRQWCIEVYSVRDRDDARWVQLALVGLPQHPLAMRLVAGDGVRSVIQALTSWLRNPETTSDQTAAPRSHLLSTLVSSGAEG